MKLSCHIKASSSIRRITLFVWVGYPAYAIRPCEYVNRYLKRMWESGPFKNWWVIWNSTEGNLISFALELVAVDKTVHKMGHFRLETTNFTLFCDKKFPNLLTKDRETVFIREPNICLHHDSRMNDIVCTPFISTSEKELFAFTPFAFKVGCTWSTVFPTR